MFDVVIIGGGPAGLSAAINAAAEGLSTVAIAGRWGGQAGMSSRLENVLGFPNGISGPALTERAEQQAKRLGAQLVHGTVERVERRDGEGFVVFLKGGTPVAARAVVVATGAHYRVPDWAKPFKGHGVHYAATPAVARHLKGHERVVVVGGGNSAGQAALFLADKAAEVVLLVRRPLTETMSFYLRSRIRAKGNIRVRVGAEVEALEGGLNVSAVRLEGGERIEAKDVFVMIGAGPTTGFLRAFDDVLDAKGFVVTGDGFETEVPGLFAVGDARSASIKRCANALGEGAAAIQSVYRRLNA